MRRYILASTALLSCGFLGATALAQSIPPATSEGQLSEVVVTAQRRSENLQDVPSTISAFTADQLEANRILQVGDLQNLVSGFTAPDPNGFQPLHLRGVGTATSLISADSAVPLYIDGVFISYPTPSLYSLTNAAAVEVDKGPQGTLFGRNATGGLIQITTRSPTDTLVADGQLTYGNYNTISGNAFVGGPVSDHVLGSFSVDALHQADGYGRDLANGEDTNRTDSDITLRTKWIFTLNSLTATLGIDYEHYFGVGTNSFQLVPGAGNIFGPQPTTSNPWDNDLGSETKIATSSGGINLRLDQDLGFAQLSSITAFRRFVDTITGSDLDVAPETAFLDDLQMTGNQVSQEFLLSSRSSGPLKWTTGLNYYWQRDTNDNVSSYGFPFYPLLFPFQGESIYAASTVSSGAVFADVTYALTSDTKLTLGGRWTDEIRKLSDGNESLIFPPTVPVYSGFAQSVHYHVPTWRAVLDHNFTPDILAYVSASRGFTAGGFNMNTPNAPPFQPEYLTAYEVGVKNELFDRRLRLNVSGFYYDYKDIQETEIIGSSQDIYNGAAAHLYGLDADAEWRVTSQFTVDETLEVLHSEFTDFPNAIFSTFEGVGVGYLQTTNPPDGAKGNQLPLASRFTSSLSGDYKWPTSMGDFDLTAAWAYNDGYVFEPDNHLRQSPFHLISASLRYAPSLSHFTVQLWGKNLLNTPIAVAGTTNILSAAELLQPPRTFGVTVGWKY